MAHVITGPDHLAAVTPLAIETRRKSWIIGFSWGIGHICGMLLTGTLFLLLRTYFPFGALTSHSELIVGVLLIIIGGYAILKARKRQMNTKHAHLHFHPTNPSGYLHIHQHFHGENLKHDHPHTQVVHHNSLLALGIGIIHGLAGFSHLIALLPSLALPSLQATLVYLAGFSIGTIAAMLGFSIPIGWMAGRLEKGHNEKILSMLTYTGAFLAIGVGLAWIILYF